MLYDDAAGADRKRRGGGVISGSFALQGALRRRRSRPVHRPGIDQIQRSVDSSVLLDVFGADPKFGARSREVLCYKAL